ncbi:SRPBCC family protein [Allocoleopsis franciscana]|uniref:SRPBCC family protein n=1 Tax=Allocoleopsis franciscana TaxID=2886352 RepID=UPI0012DCE0C7
MTTFKTSREIPATMEQVFAAISDSERLARWWEPAGFTNTFKEINNGNEPNRTNLTHACSTSKRTSVAPETCR